MKTLRKFFSSLLLIAANYNTFACCDVDFFYYDYAPFYFRTCAIKRPVLTPIYSSNDAINTYIGSYTDSVRKQKNCELWKQQTSKSVSLQDIETILYKTPLDAFLRMLQTDNKNTFIKFLKTKGNQNYISYITILKKAELSLQLFRDPWYYPHSKDEILPFDNLLAEIRECRDAKLYERCVLQEIKMLFLQRKYNACQQVWEQEQKKITNDFLRKQCYGFYLGAKFKTNPSMEILYGYAKIGDFRSLLNCSKSLIPDNTTPFVAFELFCKENLNEDITATVLQIVAEYAILTQTCTNLQQIASRMVSRNDCKNPAMWYYTMAMMEFYKNLKDYPYETFYGYFSLPPESFPQWKNFSKRLNRNFSKISNLLSKAEQAQGTDYIKESIQIFRYTLNINSSRTTSDDYICSVLKYFNKVDFVTYSEMQHLMLSHSVNKFYSGDTLHALLSLNILDRAYQIGTNNGTKYYERIREDYCYNHAYQTAMFKSLEAMPIQTVIAYANSIASPQNDTERYLRKQCFITDKNFFNEYIGTRYLREHNYKKAITYLSKIPAEYQQYLNTYEYMYRDYFSYKGFRKLFENSNYKLTFAQKMYDLQQKIKTEKNPDKKGLLLLKYAVGVGNSHTHCWALTGYKMQGFSGYWYDNAEAKNILHQAVRTFTNKELAANRLYELEQLNLIRKYYNDTQIADYMRLHCDTRSDHVVK